MELLERLNQIVVRYEEMVALYDRELAELELQPDEQPKLVHAIQGTRSAALQALALARESLRREERFRQRQHANRSRAPLALPAMQGLV